MKYLTILLLFMSGFASAQCVPVITSGEYKLKTGGEILVNPCGGRACLNQSEAKGAQANLLKSKGIRVDVIQPNLVGVCAASSASSVSSKAASSSSVARSSSSSVPVSSVAPVSSSSASSAARIPITWTCPATTETGYAISYLDIDYYELDLAVTTVAIESTGCKMSHIVDAPKDGQVYRIAAVDSLKQKSKYATFE